MVLWRLESMKWFCLNPPAGRRCSIRCLTKSCVCDIREAMFSFSSVGKGRGQGTVCMHWASHAEHHQRDLTWKHLEGHVLLCWLQSDFVCVSALLDYFYIPEDVILRFPWPEALRIWKHKRSWTGSGHHKVWDFPGKDSTSQLFIHFVVCL